MEVDQEIQLEVEDQEMILLQILHKDLMVELETLLLLGVLVVVAEQQQLVLVPVQHLVLEEQEQQIQLMEHQQLDQVVVEVVDQIMVIQVVGQVELAEVVAEPLDQAQVLQQQELETPVAEVVADNKQVRVNLGVLMVVQELY